MDRELIAENAEGIIATTGCPSGEVQTRLRLGQYDEAVKAAAAYQDIFGKENYFLELMDHGLDIERQVRDGPAPARRSSSTYRCWPPTTPTTCTRTRPTRTTACCASASARTRTTRTASGSTAPATTSRPPSEMRELFRELPDACDNTLLIAERVGDYSEVFTHVDRMPQFDVPGGRNAGSPGCARSASEGLKERYGDSPSQEVHRPARDRARSVIGPLGFDSYFLVVADICRYARDNGIPVGPGRGSRDRLDRRLPDPHHRARPAGARPAVRAVPQPGARQPARRRPRLRRPPARPDGPLRHREVRRGVHRPGQHLRHDQGQGRGQGLQLAILGYPFAMGERDHQGDAAGRDGQGRPALRPLRREAPALHRGRRVPRDVRQRPGRQEGHRHRRSASRA